MMNSTCLADAPTEATTQPHGDGLSHGKLIAIIVCSIIGVVIISIVAYLIYRYCIKERYADYVTLTCLWKVL